MAQLITLTAWRIYGPSGSIGNPPNRLTAAKTIAVSTQPRLDVRPIHDPGNASVYSLVTSVGEHGNMPVQYWCQETVAQVIALANA